MILGVCVNTEMVDGIGSVLQTKTIKYNLLEDISTPAISLEAC